MTSNILIMEYRHYSFNSHYFVNYLLPRPHMICMYLYFMITIFAKLPFTIICFKYDIHSLNRVKWK